MSALRMICIYLQRKVIKLQKKRIMINHNVCFSIKIELFFSTSLKTIGPNSHSYFMESFAIGVGTLDADILGSYDVEDKKRAEFSGMSPVKDCSLFGNESDSDVDDLEQILKDSAGKSMKSSGSDKAGALCFLNGEELLCEAEGDAGVLCLRPAENSGPEILISVMQDSRERSGKVRVRENDLVVIVAGRICGKGLKEFIGKVLERKTVSDSLTRELSKEIGEYIEMREKEVKAIVVVTKISKEL
eukprot:TRINITY_DN9940_c0_g2_i3.p1 TRINITY_DN9940_c0_g2~~TRINITY_DN9940_c0_g2_i3.p1  ORF type:complete len:245 (+),score=47.61 TRINITY_DN9940_c0_g2_i3:478-1212(+)